MKTLYVHIGTMKTGTTAIQGFCWDNQEILQKKGYCYPDFHDLADSVTRKRNGRFLVEDRGNREEEAAVFRTGMDRVIEFFKEYDNVILSNEGIWGATFSRRSGLWEELKTEAEKNGFQVKIIVYLRRQDDYISSVWNQMVKMGTKEGVRTWQEYLSRIPKGRQLDYAHKLDTIKEVLGRENIIVRVYERNQFYNQNIYDDFLNVIGLQMTDEYTIKEELINTKLSGSMHEIKRIINTMPMVDSEKNKLFRIILTECSNDPAVVQNYSMFSKEEAEKFLEEYEEGNRRVAAEYMGREDGVLFTQKVKDNPKWERDEIEMQDNTIRFIGAAYLSLLEENQQLRGELDKMKARLDKMNGRLDRINSRLDKVRHPMRTLYQKGFNKE